MIGLPFQIPLGPGQITGLSEDVADDSQPSQNDLLGGGVEPLLADERGHLGISESHGGEDCPKNSVLGAKILENVMTTVPEATASWNPIPPFNPLLLYSMRYLKFPVFSYTAAVQIPTRVVTSFCTPMLVVSVVESMY